MATFTVGEPIETREPSITVDPGLDPGRHRFELVVVTSDGRTSQPDVAVVEVVDERVVFDPLQPRNGVTR